MRTSALTLAVLLGLASSSQVWAENQIHWDGGYPASCSCGQIDVSGTIELDSNWYVNPLGVVIIKAWKDDQLVSTSNGEAYQTCCEGTWFGAILNLESGETYNVIVELQVVNGCDSEVVITKPQTIKVK